MASFLGSAAARLGASHGQAGLFALSATAAAVNASYSFDSSSFRSSNATSCEAAAAAKPKAIKKPPSIAANLQTRMTQVGRFSLLSETKTNPSIPCIVMSLTGQPLLPKHMRQLFKDRGLAERHPRFSVCLDESGTKFVPVADPSTLMDTNIRETFFPTVPRADLLEIVSDAITTPLDMQKCLWQVNVATGGEIGKSGAMSQARSEAFNSETSSKVNAAVESLLMFRAHHCMADGVSIAAVFSDLMDEAPEFQLRVQTALAKMKRKRKSWWRKLQIFLYFWCWGSLRALLYQMSLYCKMLVSPNPWKVLEQLYEEKQAKLGNNTDDVRARNLSWAEVATVDEVKTVAKYYSTKSRKVTVNDVFASCVSAAIARLVTHHRGVLMGSGTSIPQLPEMNLVIPVHLQGGVILPDQGIGNKIGALLCRVPAEQKDDVSSSDRLHQVHDRMSFLKRTPSAFLSYMVAQAFGGVGSRLGGLTPWFFSKAHCNASAVLTNVRGPDEYMHLDGRTVEAILGFLPLPPGIPVGVVITSYAGNMTLTVSAQPWAIPNADLFLSWIVEEYQTLLNEATAEIPSSTPH